MNQTELESIPRSEWNKLIAQRLGWTNVTTDGRYGHKDEFCGSGTTRCSIPNFIDSLDACAQFEATLTEEQWVSYLRNLTEVCLPASRPGLIMRPVFSLQKAMTGATPEQRCRAFLLL